LAQWYYLQKGRPVGPVSTGQLKAEISAGRIGSSDLIYLERDTSWRAAQTFRELEEAFPKAGPTRIHSAPESQKSDGAEWILLVRKQDGSGYRQKGPFHKEQIRLFIRSGEVSWTDHVWRKGLKEWYKIMALPEFHGGASLGAPPAKPAKAPPPLPDDTEISLDLSEITEKLPMPAEAEAGPPEMVGSDEELVPMSAVPAPDTSRSFKFDGGMVPSEADLQEQSFRSAAELYDHTNTIKVKKRRKKSRRKKSEGENLIRRIGLVNYYLELSGIQRSLFLIAAGVITAALVIVVTSVSTFLDRDKSKLIRPKAEYVADSAVDDRSRGGVAITEPKGADSVKVTAPVVGDSKVVVQQANVVEPPKVSPTYLKATVLSNGADNVRLRLLTDGSQHFPITVVFSGGGGRVLRVKSFARAIRLAKPEDRDVDIAGLRLPPGHYELTLAMDKLKTFSRMSVATMTADFKKQQTQHRKTLFFEFNEERLALIKTMVRIESEWIKISRFASGPSATVAWSVFYKDWMQTYGRIKNPILAQISGKNRGQYVLAPHWLELKELKSQFEGELKKLNEKKKRGQSLDGRSLQALSSQISRLKEEVLQETMWD
jgi:hypothetical protein